MGGTGLRGGQDTVKYGILFDILFNVVMTYVVAQK